MTRGRHSFGFSSAARRPPKDPATLTAGEINKELDRLDAVNSKLMTEFIAAGRGHERPSETAQREDALSQEYNELHQRQRALRIEIEMRYGPDAPSRLPTGSGKRGFGPRKKKTGFGAVCCNEGDVGLDKEGSRWVAYLHGNGGVSKVIASSKTMRDLRHLATREATLRGGKVYIEGQPEGKWAGALPDRHRYGNFLRMGTQNWPQGGIVRFRDGLGLRKFGKNKFCVVTFPLGRAVQNQRCWRTLAAAQRALQTETTFGGVTKRRFTGR